MTLSYEQREFKLQCAVVEHIPSAFPGLAFTAFPGRPGDAKDGFMKKRMGVKPGVPDLILTWNFDKGLEGGLIELKTDEGKISSAQNKFISSWHRIGWKTKVCRSVREVHNTLISWGHTPLHNACREPDFSTWDEKVERSLDFYDKLSDI